MKFLQQLSNLIEYITICSILHCKYLLSVIILFV